MTEFSDLSLTLEQVCFLVVKARQYSAKDAVTEPDPGSNPTDDGAASVLEDHGEDPIRSEIVEFIASLNADQRLDLVTLASLGREGADLAEWQTLRSDVAEAAGDHIVTELLDMPLLPDHLEEALAKFEMSCVGLESERL